MAIDTSAFDRLKKEAPKNTGGVTGINISAFGYEWGKTAETTPSVNAPVERTGVTRSIISAAPGYIKETVSNYLKEEEEIRKTLTLGQDFKRTFYEKPAKILKFVAQGIGGGLLTLGRSMQEGIATPIVGKEKAREITRGGEEAFGINWDKLISGEERVKTYQEIKDDVDAYLADSPIATPWEQKYLGGTLAFGLLALDAFPGKPNPKKATVKLIDDLVEAATEKQARKLLTDAGVEKTIARRVATKIPGANTREAVEQVIKDEFDNGIADIVAGASTRNAVPVDSAGRAVDPEDAAANLAARQAADTTPSFVKRQAIDVGEAKTKIAAAIKGVDADPAKLDELAEAFRLTDIDEKIRLFGEGDVPAKEVADKLNEIIDTERQVFFNDKGIKLPTNAQGATAVKAEDQFAKFFKSKFGKDIDEVNNIAYVNRVLNAREVGGRAALRASEAVNQTPVQMGGKTVVTNTDVAPAAKVADESFDAGSVLDLARRDQTTLNPVRAIGQKIARGRDLAKEIEGNIAKYNAKIPDKEIAAIREQNLLGPETIDEIISRKRGIITDAQSIERARSIRGTLDDVISLPKGTAATKEQLQAIEQIVQNERDINKALSVLIDNGGMAATQAERNLIKRLGQDFEKMTDHEILNHALAESTYKLKKAEVVLLGIRAETGRALQSMNKVVEGVDSRLRLLFNKINGNQKYSPLEKQAMIEMIAKLDVSDNKAFMDALEKVARSDIFDKVAEWSVAAKLWNPTTHVVNFAGNTLRQTADFGIKTITNPFAAKADIMGAAVGFKRGLSNALKALTDEGYAAQLSKYIETGGTAPAIGGKLGKWVRTPFRALGASDEIFKNVAYQRKLYRDAHAIAAKEGLKGKQLSARMEELLNTPTFKMMEDATEEAKRMTFQEDLGDFMTKIDSLRTPAAFESTGAKALSTFARFFIPFLKTPTNLFKQSIDLSPLGVVKNFKKLKQAAKDGDKEKVGTIIGESILGTAIAVYIAGEALDGNVTGGAPRNAGEKDRFYRENKLPYAIKVGDNWFEYKRLDPFATILGLTADMVTLDEKDFGSLFGVVAENLKDKTYLSGVSDLMKVLTGEDWERDYALKSMVLGGMMPSFVGHTTRSMDPTIRVADTLGQRLLVQIPGMSESFPAKVNVLGYDVQRANKGLNYFFNPIGSETAKIDPVTQELMKIDKTIAVPATSFTKDKVTYKFTDAEYEDFARFVGIKLRNDLTALFKTPKYQRSSTDEKIKLVDKLREEIQTEYKEEYVKEKTGGGRVTDVQRAKNILQGRPPNAPATNDPDTIRSYFLNE